MQFFGVPGDWEMVRLIMLCQAVSAKVSAGCVCSRVVVWRLCRWIWWWGGVGSEGLGWVGGGNLHTTWPLYKAPTLGMRALY